MWHVAKKLRGPALLSGSIEENTRCSRFFQTQSPGAERIYMRIFFFLSLTTLPTGERDKAASFIYYDFWLSTNGVISFGLPDFSQGVLIPRAGRRKLTRQLLDWRREEAGQLLLKSKNVRGQKRITERPQPSFLQRIYCNFMFCLS